MSQLKINYASTSKANIEKDQISKLNQSPSRTGNLIFSEVGGNFFLHAGVVIMLHFGLYG